MIWADGTVTTDKSKQFILQKTYKSVFSIILHMILVQTLH